MTTVCIVRFMNRNYHTAKNKIRIKKKEKDKKVEKNIENWGIHAINS